MFITPPLLICQNAFRNTNKQAVAPVEYKLGLPASALTAVIKGGETPDIILNFRDKNVRLILSVQP